MTPGTHARGEDTPAHPRRPRRTGRAWTGWRVGTPTVVLLCGALFVVSASNSEGTDLRPGRYTDLASLVQTEADEYAELQDRVRDLNTEVDGLTESVQDGQVKRFQAEIEQLEDPAGLTPRTGPGVTVTLSDAPEEVIDSSSRPINLLVVHQQDIQAVANAMWRGGASAITIQGQRVVTTTGIKCEGNAVQLQGVPYAQPYVITAVGNQAAILDALSNDDYLDVYREQSLIPDIAVGWEVELEDEVEAPAYTGLLDLQYAEVIR